MADMFRTIAERFKQIYKLIRGVLVLSAIVAILPTALWGNPQTDSDAAPTRLDDPLREKIINSICDKLNENYVYPEVAKEMETHLRKEKEKGSYDPINDIQEFAAVLTRDLRSVCNDLHLRIGYNADPPPADSSTEEEKERIENFHFKKVERMPGNVGYLRFDEFDDARYAGPTAVAAMNFLAHCDALIIDLRYNGGGAGSMIQLLLSYFFDEPVHYNNMYLRNRDVTEQNWTSAYVNGPKMTEADLYVLTSSRTFSAAEEFTADLKNLNRATIMGETTGGGAHPVEYHYLRDLNIEVKVPFGRSFNPKTGLDWEGTGIEPHVKTPVEEAFDRAYTLALKNLYLKAPEDQREIRKWMWQYR